MIRRFLTRVARIITRKKSKIVCPQRFSYSKPPVKEGIKRDIVSLCKTKSMRGSVHVIRKGGEERLHSHETVDGFWMVLSGKVRFHGDEGRLLGEFNAMEGILVPRNNRYWFESVGTEDAELLQVLRIDSEKGFQRENLEEPKFVWEESVRKHDARTST